MRLLAFLPAILALTCASSLGPRQSVACNNSPDLCSRSYSSITHLGAHDSPFVRDGATGNSVSGNQYYNSTEQLSAGVRLLSAQVHYSNGDWHLCHSSCDLLDAGVLSAWLSTIKTWLDANPDDVVTVVLVNSDNATPADLAAEYATSGIMSYVYMPPSISSPPSSWPTLQELISANTRLLTFVASLDISQISSSEAFLMDEFTFIFETQYQITDASQFSCLPNRPSSVENDISAAISSNRMPFMNHFLDQSALLGIETPDVDEIGTTNSPSTSSVANLGGEAQACKTAWGKAPTFILVDFFNEGPAIATVDSLNGVTNPVGRAALPARGSGMSRTELDFQAVEQLVQQVHEGQTPSKGAWIWAGGVWGWGGINLNGGNVFSK